MTRSRDLADSADKDITGTLVVDGLTSSGNVGIGTDSPTGNVEIATSASDTGVDLVLDGNKSSNGGIGSIIFNNAGDSVGMIRSNRASANDAADMLFFTQATGGSNTERMRIDASGNVGIGVSSPSYTLTVQKDVDDYIAKLENDGNSTSSNGLWVDTRWNTATNTPFQVTTNSGTAPVIVAKGDGNVGIGTSSPQRTLHVHDDSTYIQITNDTTGTTSSDGFRMGYFTGQTLFTMNQQENDGLVFSTNNSEAMRIDSSGNLLVGKTSANIATNGVELKDGDNASTLNVTTTRSSANSGQVALFNRLSTDGDILDLRKDGSTVGTIGVLSSRMTIGTGDVGLFFDSSSSDAIEPHNMSTNSARDAGIDLGASGSRFRDLHISRNAMAANFVGTDDTDTFIAMTGSNLQRFFTGGVERMRIDSSGNLLVGTTDTTIYDNNAGGTADNGLNLRGDGKLDAARYNGIVLGLNRTGTDGTLAEFRKNGSTVGTIGTHTQDSNSNFYIGFDRGSSDVGLGFGHSAGTGRAYYPCRDDGSGVSAAIDIGTATYKYKDLHLSTNIHQGATAPSSSAAGVLSEAVGRVKYSRGSGTGGFSHCTFVNGNGTVGSITTSGNATAYNTSSDYRLKENVTDVTDGITRVKQLTPKRFNFIADADTTVDGFLAHEAATVIPEAVTGTKDAMMDEEYEVTAAVTDDDGNVVEEAVMGTRSVPDYQGIDQSKIVPLLTAALQEAIAKIETLETRLTALEG